MEQSAHPSIFSSTYLIAHQLASLLSDYKERNVDTVNHEYLQRVFMERRYKSRPYVRLHVNIAGHGKVHTLIVTNGPLPNTFDIKSYYDRNHLEKADTYATVYPDDSVVMSLPRYMHIQQRYTFVMLTGGRFVLDRVRSVQYNTQWRARPRVVYRQSEPENKYFFWTPDNQRVEGTYWDVLVKAKEYSIPVHETVVIEKGIPRSGSPVLTRKWVPEARKLYLVRRRKLLLHSLARVKVGGFDDAIKELDGWNDTARVRRDQYSRVRVETSSEFTQLDADSNATANALVESSLVRWHRWPVKSREELERSVRQFVNQNAEELRREMGAVVYS
jgi:hypothetical protein